MALIFSSICWSTKKNQTSDTNDIPSDWLANGYCGIIWFLSTMEEKASSRVMFLETAKNILDFFKEEYDDEKNIFRDEHFFYSLEGKMSIPVYCRVLRCILDSDELEVYQHLVTEPKILREQDFTIVVETLPYFRCGVKSLLVIVFLL